MVPEEVMEIMWRIDSEGAGYYLVYQFSEEDYQTLKKFYPKEAEIFSEAQELLEKIQSFVNNFIEY